MTQYLLSVHTVEGEAEPEGEELQKIFHAPSTPSTRR